MAHDAKLATLTTCSKMADGTEHQYSWYGVDCSCPRCNSFVRVFWWLLLYANFMTPSQPGATSICAAFSERKKWRNRLGCNTKYAFISIEVHQSCIGLIWNITRTAIDKQSARYSYDVCISRDPHWSSWSCNSHRSYLPVFMHCIAYFGVILYQVSDASIAGLMYVIMCFSV